MKHIKNLFSSIFMYFKLIKNNEVVITKESVILKPIDKKITVIDGGFRKKYFKPSKNIISDTIEL